MTDATSADFDALDGDLAASVEAGIIAEGQAAGIAALARARQTRREIEPVAFFRGLNDLFVALGVGLLLAATLILVPLLPAIGGVMIPVFVGLAEIITRQRRMIAPSLVLAVAVPLSVLLTAGGLVGKDQVMAGNTPIILALIGLASAVAFYLRYRLPFSLFVAGLGTYGTLIVVWASTQGIMGAGFDRELFTAFAMEAAWIGIGCGIAGFVTAMAFDIRDPLRVTRLAHCGFWLHVLSAAALVNAPLALLRIDGDFPVLPMMAVIATAAVIALIVDRRAFVMAGVATQGAIIFSLIDTGARGGQATSAALSLAILGAGVVVLGLGWRRIRRRLFRLLPGGTWRTRLPPVAGEVLD
ncbi:MAG: hypothetical protein AAF577_13970 [Pseudomonadota bacterium]